MLKKKRILLVDDCEKLWKKLLIEIFNEDEYEITSVKEFNNSFPFAADDYDVLIVDYFLEPELNGVKWVKENIRNKDSYLPVIFWTSSYDPEVIKETLVGNKIFFKKDLDLYTFKKEVDLSIAQSKQWRLTPLHNNFFGTKITKDKYRNLAHKVYVSTSKYLESFFAHSKYHAVLTFPHLSNSVMC